MVASLGSTLTFLMAALGAQNVDVNRKARNARIASRPLTERADYWAAIFDSWPTRVAVCAEFVSA